MDDYQLSKEQIQKILDIKNDFYRYADNNLWIRSKSGEIIKFVPNKPQKALIDYVIYCLSSGIPIRAIVLKARQMGLSTAIEALGYWWNSTNKNQTAVIIGHEEKSAKNLYMMFRRYYDNSNPIFKPSIKYNTKSDLSFERYDETGKQVGLGSVIKTATAKNTSAGRSDTIQFLHASEVGEWENGEELVASLMQTVPFIPKTFIFLESTAKGKGNYFHKEWRNAEKGLNNFIPFFFPWWLIDEYEDYNDEDVGELTEYEEFLVDLFNKGFDTWSGEHYDVEIEQIVPKIKFYRRKSRDFASDPARMYQEYPSIANEAFVASGANVFPVLKLAEMELQCLEVDEYDYYKLITGDAHEDFVIEKIPYDPNVDDFTYVAPLKIFEEPVPGKEYVIGGDVAEGLKTGDYSVAEVVEVTTMKTVARWRGHVDPDRFGEILGALGAYYNYALIGVEVNNHGLTTIQKLRDTFYTNLFKRDRGYDEDFEEPTSNLGWKTDVRTKRLMIDGLIRIIREGLNEDKDEIFVEEAFAFVRDDRGRMNAEEGEHDDTIIAKAIAFQLFPWGDNDTSKLEVHKPKGSANRKSKHKVIKR
jgi:stalled ribosome alternative rescue factor ArfA